MCLSGLGTPIAALYSGVKLRRRGRSARGPSVESLRTPPSSALSVRVSAKVAVTVVAILTRPQYLVRCSRTLLSQLTLPERGLRDRQYDYLRFTTDRRIPPDNNGSERDIRMIKLRLRQKVSGSMRTLTGAKQFCAIRSYLSTAAKHGRSFFDTLVMLAEGRPWLPETT